MSRQPQYLIERGRAYAWLAAPDYAAAVRYAADGTVPDKLPRRLKLKTFRQSAHNVRQRNICRAAWLLHRYGFDGCNVVGYYE